MKEKFEKIDFDGADDVAPQLYKRTRHNAAGKPLIRYFALWTDWQGIRRKMPLGANLKAAKLKIHNLDYDETHKVDFDEQKQKREARGMTFEKFITVNKIELKSPWHKAPLLAFFGNKTIAAIADDDVLAYRKHRATEPMIRCGKPTKKLLTQATINKEVGALRKTLKIARAKGFDHRVTRFAMVKETPRNRTLTIDEFHALLEHCPDWLRRVVAFAWETALSRSDLFRLTWSEIDLKEGIIELKNGRAKTGKPQALPIHTPELEALIDELQQERHRLPNTLGLVFTMPDGHPIDELKFEYWFRRACRKAGIKNLSSTT
jgi:integrase